MLLRISLGLAILAGATALYFSHFKVADKINNLTTERDEANTARDNALAEAGKAKKDAKTARAELETVSRDFAAATNLLAETQTKLSEQQDRANQLDERLTAVTGERNVANQQLAQWRALNVQPDQIQKLNNDLKNTREERDIFIAENKVLQKVNNDLQVELDKYTGGEREVKLPAGLKGQVVAVDPKYDFVVLNIGEKQGVLENGKMLVNRDGKLVAKVKITKVQANRSIANILQDWKQDEVMEGDQVLY